MLIAIISDSHDNIYNIEKFLDWAEKNKIEMIIHCGDICAASVMRLFGERFNGQIYLVLGIVVSGLETLKKKSADLNNVVIYYDGVGELKIEGQRIGFCHYPDQANVMASSGEYDLVFYGHDHKPWMKTLDNGCQLINPGTLAGMFNKATFATYDTESKKIELVLVENT